ncbi:MAG TPA: energy transducer TonB [Rikenellaceae bacterium]|nr:energy transducer TonB [Rikenellaceae bacterium]
MEIKKTEGASLENKRLLFIEIGLIIALAVTYVAFSWSTKEKQTAVLDAGPAVTIEEENIPITQEAPPPPPETPKVPVLSDQIDIIDDDIQVEDNILNLDDNDDLVIEIKDYIEGPEEEEIEEEEIPYVFVEQKPSFKGGDANAFSKWVASQLVYPEIAKENGVQGRVMISFTIKADGSVANVRVTRSLDPALDKEAVRVVSSSPKWTPGKQRDRAVNVTYSLPVIFQLR